MLTADELASCKRAFLTFFDANSDGVIDLGELRAALVTLGHPNPTDTELQTILHSMDKDGSGGIEFEEFVKVIEQQKAQQMQRGDEADTIEAFVAMGGQPDKSGWVEVPRLQRTIAEFELDVRLDALLEQMDLDADGSVSYEEFKALLTPQPI